LDDDQDGGWVNVSSGTGSPWLSWTKGCKRLLLYLPASVLFFSFEKRPTVFPGQRS